MSKHHMGRPCVKRLTACDDIRAFSLREKLAAKPLWTQKAGATIKDTDIAQCILLQICHNDEQY